jgi:type III secretion protein V
VLVVAVIAMMVVPLPTPLVDLLIALNLTFGVLLLAAALYMRDALSFAAFPTLLLLSTLYRLALNVSSTRLILLQADAGQVIEAFGSFVVRGDYRVGALVFAMLTLIQFIVIARGAERVAEVSARFSLDALPGKQLAIDAELRAGALRPEAARAQRRRLERESQLFGALDGALKFVKGDAIAGIVITLVNFIGGVALGVFARDLPLQTSLTTYGLLTIGDGLVTQIPALLGATAAGLVVTRVSPDTNEGSLAREISKQLLHEPRALAVSALVLAGLALVPELPSWPFALLAALCVFGSVASRRRTESSASAIQQCSLLTLQLGRSLHAELFARRAGGLSAALERERHALLAELGVELPEPDVQLDRSLPARSFRFLWRELPVSAAHEVTRDPVQAIAAALLSLGRARAADCLDLDSVQHMIDRLEAEQPALVRLTIPRPLSPALLARVLRLLVAEGVSVRWLGEIVEAVAAHAGSGIEAPQLAEHARRALARRISHALAPRGQLHVLRVAPEVEETLSDALRNSGNDQVLALPPELARELEGAIAEAHKKAPAPHALVTQAELRRHLRALVVDAAPDLAVVSAHELMPELELSTSAPIGP